MKKPVFLFGILVAGTFAFSSCTKNLKDDIKDLQKQVDSLDKSNSELDEKIKDIENAIGSNEPIAVTSTFVDDNSVTRTIKDVYRFKSSGSSTHSLRQLNNGTYEVYIERFSDVDWWEGAWIAFTYAPSTKAITRKRGGHYWEDYNPYNNRTRYDGINYTGSGLTIDINLKNLNLTTGEIALDFSANATADYTNTYTSNSPNPGQAMSTTFSFTGKLRLFPYED